jgi:hypothetical protein
MEEVFNHEYDIIFKLADLNYEQDGVRYQSDADLKFISGEIEKISSKFNTKVVLIKSYGLNCRVQEVLENLK